ncbi:MAG: WYL domain-containing protein, partial [Clostridia bacterium]|nr:WYL domain-containing protein [Clostridia bacterium]
YLLADGGVTEKELSQKLESMLSGEIDFDVIDALFSKKEGEESTFLFKDGVFVPALDYEFPVRTSLLERQAMMNSVNGPYAKHFLSEDTIAKLQKILNKSDWTLDSIDIKGQYSEGLIEDESRYQDVKNLRQAIVEHVAIKYDNILPGKYEYLDAEIFPVKMEYSIKNDQLRLVAFDEAQRRFIKMNLSTMSNIRVTDKSFENLEEEYIAFIEANTFELILEVEPTGHFIERCFRIFSYYDRKAIYDKEANTYKLKVKYLKFDENEIIRDVLSLGSSVVVREPKALKREVVRRIKLACENYSN